VGQPIAWDPATSKTIDQASFPENGYMKFGVVQNIDGVKQIREVFGGRFNACELTINVKKPACGTPPVKHAFGGCLQCGVPYTVKVTLQNDESEKTLSTNRVGKFEVVATHMMECDNCDDCPTNEFDGAKFFCELADKLNDQLEGQATVVPAFQWKHEFTYNPQDTQCEDCSEIAPISQVTIGGDTFALENTLDPGGSGNTLVEQIPVVIDEINCVLKGKGYAYALGGVNDCCEGKIVVVTCVGQDSIAIPGYTPVVTDNFADIPLEERCKSCNPADGTFSPAQGLTVIGAHPEHMCGCYPDDMPVVQWASKIEIYGLDGWENGYFHVVDDTLAVAPSGIGYDIQQMEYNQYVGGLGAEHNPYNATPIGSRYPNPGPNSRAGSTTADCKKLYCLYNILHNPGERQQRGFQQQVDFLHEFTLLAIPEGDANTQTSVNAFWEGVRAVATNCGSYPEVTCDYTDPTPVAQEDYCENRQPV
jgi:hypothetical protein